MTSDELLARTAQYQIQYSTSTRRRRRPRRVGLQPSQEYLTGFRSPLQSLERTVLMGPDSHLSAENEPAGRDAPDPQAEFRVTTQYDDTTEDNVFIEREDESLPSVAELERIQAEDDPCSTSEDDSASDDDDDDNDTNSFDNRRQELHRRIAMARRLQQQMSEATRRRHNPTLVDPIPALPPTVPGGSTSNAEVLKPHARFLIEREKSMVSIKFDPPPCVPCILCPVQC